MTPTAPLSGTLRPHTTYCRAASSRLRGVPNALVSPSPGRAGDV